MRPFRSALRWTAGAVVVAWAAAAVSASMVIAPTFAELVARSRTVFVGETIGVESRWAGAGAGTGSGDAIVTRVTFRVERVLKGELGGQTVLEFLGGRVGEDRLVVAGMPRFRVGDEDVLFVDDRGRAMCPVVGMKHGRFRVLEDPGTGRRSVARSGFEPLAAVGDIGAAKAPARVTSVQALTLGAFAAEIEREVGRQRVAR